MCAYVLSVGFYDVDLSYDKDSLSYVSDSVILMIN